MNGEEEDAEMRAKAWEERRQIVEKYDRGRTEGAVIYAWEQPEFEYYHKQDRFGFIHDERLPDHSKKSEREKKQNEKEMSRADKWAKMLKEPKKFFPPGAKNRDIMVGRVWKGVPQRVRGEFWKILLDIDTMKKEQEGVYSKMKELARRFSPDIRQIDLDVNRTYRNHDMFRDRYNSKQQDLFHVLAAYSMYNTEVGYCQGMSQIAALLLMYLLTEEDAFWALHKLMIGRLYKMHGFFIPQFPKLIRFQEHYERILTKKLPRLHKHLLKNGVESGIYTLKWFFQCFLDRLPYSLVIRVWDMYLLEGESIMFAMAYTILKLHRSRMLRMGMDDLLEFLQKTLESNFGYDDDFVIETALRQNLQELRSSRLHTAGDTPAKEEPVKPFGMERLPTAEEELGYRQPFTDKEREFSHHTIQREEEAVRRLQHLNSQTSIDEGSFDHSLNETGSLEPGTEDHISDLLEQDISLESPSRSRTHSPSHRSRSRTGSGQSGAIGHHQPFLPPSPLPQSREQDVLDSSLIYLMKEAGLGPSSSSQPRPASADPHAHRHHPAHTQEVHKRHSAHVGGEFGRSSGPVALPTPPPPPAFLDTSRESSGSSSGGGGRTTTAVAAASSSRSSRHSGSEKRSGKRNSDPSGSGNARSSSGSGAARGSYYYGEHPHHQDLINGHQEDSWRSAVTGSQQEESWRSAVASSQLEDSILNSSFENATPHKGEVVRIRVPFSADANSSGSGNSSNVGETGDIERQAKEISPRFNGHKVTIQVNQASSYDPADELFPSPLTFQPRPVSAHQLTKQHVSTSERKLNSQGEIHRSTHSMFVTEYSEQRSSPQDPVMRSVQSRRYYEETSRVDGAVVDRKEEYHHHQYRDPHQGNGYSGDGTGGRRSKGSGSSHRGSPHRTAPEYKPRRLSPTSVRDGQELSTSSRPSETFF